jgi:DNA-binding NarL/FixJ family response regulator
MMEPLRILLAEDNILFRRGLAALLALRQDMEVVGEAGDGIEAVVMARETEPDLILMDVGMPTCDGLEATRQIKSEMPQVRIIMLTVCDDEHNLFGAIKSGADGYLLKSLEPDQLFDMLEGARHGVMVIT